MRKKLVVLAMVALVALVTATPGLASGNGVNGGSYRQFFSVLGTITAIDGDTITVQVLEGSRLVWPYIGQALTVQMTPTTLYYKWTPDGLLSITFSDVKVGNTTNIHGTVAEDGDFTAGRVTVSP
jgi:hypothetical protein